MERLSLFIIFVTTILLGACSSKLPIAMPFKVLEQDQSHNSYTVIVTYAEVKPDNKSQDLFSAHTDKVLSTINTHKGLYGYSVRRELIGNKAWTLTIWSDEEAITDFIYSRAHRPAVDDAPNIITASSFAQIKITADELPYSWEKALALLNKE